MEMPADLVLVPSAKGDFAFPWLEPGVCSDGCPTRMMLEENQHFTVRDGVGSGIRSSRRSGRVPQ